MARYSQTKVELSLKSPGKNSRAFKAIVGMVAKEREKVIRGRCIAAAQLARDAVADNAPNTLFMRLLHSEKLERYYNKNPGYDVRMDAGARFTFVLKLSTNRFPPSKFKGYNPVWGMIVSNYGRRAIDIARPSAIPLPVDSAVSGRRGTRTVKNKRYNHPTFGTGYQGRYAGKFVHFVQHVDAVVGTNWIEEGLNNAESRILAILSGKDSGGTAGLQRGARISKSSVL